MQLGCVDEFPSAAHAMRLCEASGDLCEDAAMLDVVFVVGLELGGEAAGGVLEGVFGGGVDHSRLHKVSGLC